MTAPIWIVKLAPAERAVTTGCTRVERVVLHVVAAIVKDSSICRKIRLFAVTCVVLICSVGLVPVGTATAPSGAAAQTAGDAPLAQFVTVEYDAARVAPVAAFTLKLTTDVELGANRAIALPLAPVAGPITKQSKVELQPTLALPVPAPAVKISCLAYKFANPSMMVLDTLLFAAARYNHGVALLRIE